MDDDCIKPDKHGWILEGFIPCTCKTDKRKAEEEAKKKNPYEQCPECKLWDSKIVVEECGYEYYRCDSCNEMWDEYGWPEVRK